MAVDGQRAAARIVDLARKGGITATRHTQIPCRRRSGIIRVGTTVKAQGQGTRARDAHDRVDIDVFGGGQRQRRLTPCHIGIDVDVAGVGATTCRG